MTELKETDIKKSFVKETTEQFKSTEELQELAKNTVKQMLNKDNPTDCILFIHGYSNSLKEDIIPRLKLLDVFLGSKTVPKQKISSIENEKNEVHYSLDKYSEIVCLSFNWKCSMLPRPLEEYSKDKSNIEQIEYKNLSILLESLQFEKDQYDELEDKHIYIICHSMGNYCLYQTIINNPKTYFKLLKNCHIVAIAADVELKGYENLIKKVLEKKSILSWTHYYNPNDIVLKQASNIINSTKKRAGNYDIKIDNNDLYKIKWETKLTEQRETSLGHSYIDTKKFLKDLRYLVILKEKPNGNNRKNILQHIKGNKYRLIEN